MKRTTSILMYALFALTALYPAGTILAACFGYTFKLINVSVFAFVIAAVSAVTFVLDIVAKNAPENMTRRILSILITPVSVINAAFYIFESPQIWVIANMLFSLSCCCYLAAKYGRPLALKIVALALSAQMIFIIGYFGFIAAIFGNIGQTTVVKSVDSPNGTYCAQVISNDQGALGGDTVVEVYTNNATVSAWVFTLEKKPRTVYVGEWYEYERIRLCWKDDTHLFINGKEYSVK